MFGKLEHGTEERVKIVMKWFGGQNKKLGLSYGNSVPQEIL